MTNKQQNLVLWTIHSTRLIKFGASTTLYNYPPKPFHTALSRKADELPEKDNDEPLILEVDEEENEVDEDEDEEDEDDVDNGIDELQELDKNEWDQVLESMAVVHETVTKVGY